MLKKTTTPQNENLDLMDMPKLNMNDFPFVSNSKYLIREVGILGTGLVTLLVWTKVWDVSQIILFVVWMLCVYVFALLASYNLRTGYFPDWLQARVLFPLVTIFAILNSMLGNASVWSPLLGLIILGGSAFFYYLISKGKWIGFGSVKLLTLAGLLIGFSATLPALIIIILGLLAVHFFTKSREIQVGWLIFTAVVVSKILTLLITL